MNAQLNLEQGSEEWRAARCGSLGASQIADMLAKTKSGWGASRDNLLAQLVVERLTGKPTEGYKSAAMQRGNDLEPDAVAAYEFFTGETTEKCGIFPHPSIQYSHASPDRLVGLDTLLEVKCPEAKAHMELLLDRKIPDRYQKQMTWQLICTGRSWCDFASYHPDFPPSMQLIVMHFGSTVAKEYEAMEDEVKKFLAEVDATLKRLEALE